MADGKVVISTRLDNTGFEKGIGKVSGSLGGLKSVLGQFTRMIATAFSATAVIRFGVESSKAAMQLTDALTGLQSIVEGQGRSFTKAKTFLDEYVSDGLIPMTNAVTAYKNLAMRGYDDSQIQQALIALKDASAYGRQASLSMGEAVQSATEGLKNENSILVDNAGVTKNVAKMWDEYAKSIGTTAANLTQQQKIQAEVAGILEESKYQTGDAAKVAGTLSGQLQQLSFNFNNLKIAVGNMINPIVRLFLPTINAAVTTVTRFANAAASLVSTLTGVSVSVSSGTEGVADGYSSAADSADDLADATTAAGKAAKKSLAGFDELNKLSDPKSSTNADTVSDSTSTKVSISADLTVSEGEDQVSPALQGVVDKIHELLEPLKKIDLSKVKKAFDGLRKSFKQLGKVISTNLEAVWFNILVPLAEWTIEKAAPALVEALASALEFVAAASEALAPLGASLWENFFKPLAEFAGSLIVSFLELLTDALSGLARWIRDNENTFRTMVTVFGSFITTLLTVKTAAQAFQAAKTIFSTASVAISSALTSMISPVNLAAAAIAALVAVGVAIASSIDSAIEPTDLFTEEQWELVSATKEAAKAFQDQQEATKKAMSKVNIEMGRVKELADELYTLADASGRVQEKDQARVDFILNEMNKALGTEYEMIDGVILRYNELVSSIDDVIASKTANALLDAANADYVTALQEEAEAWSALSEVEKAYEDQLEKVAQLREKYESTNPATTASDIILTKLIQEEEALSSLADEYESAKTIYEGYQSTISSYEKAAEQILLKNYDTAKEILIGKQNAYGQYTNSVIEARKAVLSELEKEAYDTKLKAEEMKAAFDAGVEGIGQEMVDEAYRAYLLAQENYLRATLGMEAVVEDFGSRVSKKVTSWKDAFKDAMQGLLGSATQTKTDIAEIFSSGSVNIGTQFAEKIAEGFKNSASKVKNAVNSVWDKLSPSSGGSASSLSGIASTYSVRTPSVPLLAKGAVLPANKPFLAMVGDQHHGTNVEAPLSTIQDAVAAVMDGNTSAMIACFNALLEENRALRSTVEQIQIGDSVIGEAAGRYMRKMAVVTGG